MIRASELATLLASDGFQLVYEDGQAMEFVLARPVGELFERIRVSHGNAGATVTVGAEIAIVPGRTALKGLCIHRCLVELASDQSTGWTTLNNERSADAFIERIHLEAPKACRNLVDEAGTELLTATRAARNKSSQYLAILERVGTNRMREQISERGQAEVNRIMQQRIVCIPEGRVFYEVALQTIACYCGEVENDADWLRGRDADSMSDRELMIRLQIIASRLAREQGWPSAA